jgi:outer membrane protein OmpU
MTNIKKIGLTALAGTLATITAHAGEMSVSGTAQMTFNTTAGTTAGATDDNTDSFAVNSSLVFSGSGELDNGFGVSVMSNLTGGSQTVANMQLDMGDMGVLSMDTGSDLTGLPAYQDVVPNAGEQAWDDTGAADASHGRPAQGIVNPRADNTIEESLGYKVSANGFTLSAHTSFGDGNGSEQSAVIAMDGLVDGLTIGAGMGNNASSATTDDDLETYFIKYTMGAVTVGAQSSKVDAETAATDVERDAYGISFAVNENLSISYGVSDTEFDASASDEENTGISASYTAGGATVGLVHNTKDNTAGTAGADHENVELKLTFAF